MRVLQEQGAALALLRVETSQIFHVPQLAFVGPVLQGQGCTIGRPGCMQGAVWVGSGTEDARVWLQGFQKGFWVICCKGKSNEELSGNAWVVWGWWKG